MMSAKMVTPGLLKIKTYGVIISVYDVTNKFDSNYNLNVVMWPIFATQAFMWEKFL